MRATRAPAAAPRKPPQASNPFVVRFYYSFTSPDKLFLVMEYCPGGDLSSLLQVRVQHARATTVLCFG